MRIIDQHTKKIMEDCKRYSRQAGLSFDNETLEYIVTNKDMLELSPKVMIPTLYDYWVHDVEVLKGQGKYKLYPSNPYETVINSRPAISFYNDNNPDWMNIMIFYHVLGHIDFFQNNKLFEHTWNQDFVGQALSDKRLIASLRSKYNRWVDYIIEFSRSLDNVVGYFNLIARNNFPSEFELPKKLEYYFDVFLQDELKLPDHIIYNEVSRYNSLKLESPINSDQIFFNEVIKKYPEFHAKFERYEFGPNQALDVMEFLVENSPFLNLKENDWMKSIVNIVRNTSLYFNPQIRTKIINEGWASYWHDKLFIADKRIKGHESGYSKLNAGVTSISRVGLNPYAIGLRLIQHIEDSANKGKISREYQDLYNIEGRDSFNKDLNIGQKTIFSLRQNFSDFMLINTFVDQEFVDRFGLFVVGQRQNQQRNTIEYYIKSKKAEDYKEMLLDSLYHPPKITVDTQKTNRDNLYLVHHYEKKQLYQSYIPETLIGIEYLWGAQVQFQTTEIHVKKEQDGTQSYYPVPVLYTIKDRKIEKKNL